jgi:hypothetical protein
MMRKSEMLNDNRVRNLLNEILESPEFKDSQRYRDLLQYLVEESIAGRTPKEVTIGMRLFGKDASFNSKDDATVRVYMNNLRKKIEHYYFTCSKPYSHKLSIPVGHYKVEFIPSAEKSEPAAQPVRSRLYAFIALGVAAAFIFGYFTHSVFQSKNEHFKPPNPIWNDFIKPNGRPTLVIFGDYFFLREHGSSSDYYRNIRINSPEDYRLIVSQDPNFAKKYDQNDFTFLRPSAPWGLSHILPILQNSSNSYSFKLASQFTVGDFKSSNIVFLGSFKTLFHFQKFLHIFRLEYTIAPSSFKILGASGDSAHQFSPATLHAGNYEKDFAIVAKGAGPDGSVLMMLLGFSETGVIEAVRAACDPELGKTLENRYAVQPAQDPFYFTLVLSAEGMTQAIFNSDMRYFTLNKPLNTISDSMQKDSLRTK